MIPFSNEDLTEAVNHVISTKVKPTLALDGGGIDLLKVDSPNVYVRLTGACVGCSSSTQTIKFSVEREIKNQIHQELVVVEVPFGVEY